MIGLFKRDRHKDEFEKLHHRLTHSFAKVKDDISDVSSNVNLVNQWINYFHQRIQAQEKQLAEMLKQLSYVPKSQHEIKEIIDNYYKLDDVLSKIDELHERVDAILERHEPLAKKMDDHHERLSQLELSHKLRRPSFREKIVQKITRNSKEYVKGLMLSLIRKYERISALQLREIIVEEQGLCSKSSFYRLLGELEDSDEVEVVQDRKEKYYIYKVFPTHQT